MTSHSRPARILSAILFVLAAAAPLSAAVKKHAALHPAIEKVNISGTVTDAVTGAPLKGATVSSGESYTLTDDAGHYTLTCFKSGLVSAARGGYITVQKEATTSPLDFALPQSPTVTVKTTKGQTLILDATTVKFGYPQVFQGYASGESPNLCRVNGSEKEHWEPKKSEIKRIIGPARSVSAPACCDRGPTMAIDLELKTGETVTGYLEDACFGYGVEVIGIERASATPKYTPLTEVTEIVFP